eukprot:Nk52_evm89s224 gene=Nk52_evmTU89s224
MDPDEQRPSRNEKPTLFFENTLRPAAAASQFPSESEIKTFLVNIAEQGIGYYEEALRDKGKDASVYTGGGGAILSCLKLSQCGALSHSERVAYFERGALLFDFLYRDYTEGALRLHGPSFLCGSSGFCVLGAMISKLRGEHEKQKQFINLLLSIPHNTEHSCELMYGKAGLLFSYLMARRNLGTEVVSKERCVEIIDSIYMQCTEYVKKNLHLYHPQLLMCEWHGKPYLGGAHGICGILLILLYCKEDGLLDESEYAKDIEERLLFSVKYVVSIQETNGNFPSSSPPSNSSPSKLVQWCHGAPGIVPLLCRYMKVYGNQLLDNSPLEAALACVWARGLLTKGFGLCHGLSGNGYAFLLAGRTLAELRGEAVSEYRKYLAMSREFLRFAMEDAARFKQLLMVPNRPFSLYEGLCGLVCFTADILQPKKASFPGYELNWGLFL